MYNNNYYYYYSYCNIIYFLQIIIVTYIIDHRYISCDFHSLINLKKRNIRVYNCAISGLYFEKDIAIFLSRKKAYNAPCLWVFKNTFNIVSYCVLPAYGDKSL